MTLSIDPKEFAKLALMANPSNSESVEDKAKDSLELYLSAYKLAEKYARFSNTTQETSEAFNSIRDIDINM
ncbi:hypothetical protein J4760_01655 [Salinicoccus sp. ID82-1]|uniref:Uncharacterized protein n=1 Tax=Salinicoccus cyprini TaxID=2493691 RepID=A0A558AYA4_9STAP|nr:MULTISPECIES: hypothetical protein [Salinicoccus]MCG1008751.1 hypothetical protein [Salinicoccus sp. ID82-1]TVT29226.1 hypothetical protein FO441_02785 [Salinicoccus cyprini]